jgi:hypothetical protein
MRPEAIRKMFEKRIVKIMEKIRKVVTDAGYYCTEISLIDGDYYSWYFICHTLGKPETNDLDDDMDIDFQFIITESEYWDGTTGGVSFKIDINTVGGQMLGGFTPFNYSDNVWVSRSNKSAIRERFKLMEEASIDGIPAMLHEHVSEHKG